MTKIIKEMDFFTEEMKTYYNVYKGIIVLNDFEILRVKVNDEGVVRLNLDKRTIQDASIANLLEKIEEACKIFDGKWIH